MAGFFSWFNTGPPNAWDPVLRAIVAHFYVVSIHPFGQRTYRESRGFLLYKAGSHLTLRTS